MNQEHILLKLQEARRNRARSLASNFKVGAAFESSNGAFVSGTRTEDRGKTLVEACAERNVTDRLHLVGFEIPCGNASRITLKKAHAAQIPRSTGRVNDSVKDWALTLEGQTLFGMERTARPRNE